MTEGVCRYLKEVYNIELNIPLEVEVTTSDNWNDSEAWREEYLK